MAITKIKGSNIEDGTVVAADIADGSVTDAKITALDSTKLTGTIATARLSNVDLTTLSATNLTSGSIADARVPASAVTQHVAAVDLSAVRQDIAMLAMYNSVSDNRAAYNLPFSFVDHFEDSSGLTTLTDVARNGDEYVSTISGGGLDSYTKLLLHMDDTGLTDSSATGHTTTLVGNAQRSSAQSKFGSYSMLSDGSGDYLTVADHSELQFNSVAFTLDFWFRLTNVPAIGGTPTSQVFFAGATDSRWILLAFRTDQSSLNMRMEVSGSGTNAWNGATVGEGTKTSWTADTWYHLAVVRATGTPAVRVYIDGVLDMTYPYTAALNCSSNLQIWGKQGGGYTNHPAGYMDEFRLSVGIERWTGNFTPPTEAYGALVTNATGTLISDTQTAPAATTKMSGVILYKDNAGTGTLGTDLKIYLSANNGTNWTEVVSYGAVTPLFSAGIKMVRLGETTVTSGTAPVIKAVWANQASGSKETQLHGWAMNY